MDEVIQAQKEAERHGTLHAGGRPSVRDIFEGVYAEMPRISAVNGRRRGTDMARMTMIEAVRSAMDVSMAPRRKCRRLRGGCRLFSAAFPLHPGASGEIRQDALLRYADQRVRYRRHGHRIGRLGLKPCVEIQLPTTCYPAYDQLTQEAARIRYRSNGDFTADSSCACRRAAASSAARPTARARRRSSPMFAG